MKTLVDTRTMMVMHVYTDEGQITYPAMKDDDNDFGQMEYDYD